MYEFKKLSDVTLLDSVPEGATVLAEVDGVINRVPGGGLGGGTQSDWNQNDSTAADYVKNRPGGYSKSYPEVSFSFDLDAELPLVGGLYIRAFDPVPLEQLKAGTLTIASVDTNGESSEEQYLLGDIPFEAYTKDIDTNEFTILVRKDSMVEFEEESSIDIAAGVYVVDIRQTIDDVSNITSFTETLSLPAITLDQEIPEKYTAVKSADMSGTGAVKNRIGGCGAAAAEIKWDGFPDGLPVVTVGGQTYARISDDTPPIWAVREIWAFIWKNETHTRSTVKEVALTRDTVFFDASIGGYYVDVDLGSAFSSRKARTVFVYSENDAFPSAGIWAQYGEFDEPVEYIGDTYVGFGISAIFVSASLPKLPYELVETNPDEAHDYAVLNSSTEGSTKKFKITVDDSGTLTATEITTT